MSSQPRTFDTTTKSTLRAASPGTARVRAGYRRLVERLGHTRWFAGAMRTFGARVDTWLYRLSGGRLSIAGPSLFPVLLLTTTGRRSGRQRTTPLIYVRGDGDALIVSSESFGHKRPAAWPLNLAADPRASVQLGTRSGAYVAHPATAVEVERYWPALLNAWPAHDLPPAQRRSEGLRAETFSSGSTSPRRHSRVSPCTCGRAGAAGGGGRAAYRQRPRAAPRPARRV